ncbi:NAD-dependent epimerase/dehydratase family protein [Paenibacillus sp. D2_2]|uniref:NAD-dependent epimerase/dehydratase family protein n=1 Tax=Paenibacillus sp. D2_2 TaxID=3073092 RepID=UPI00281501B0|nr:NAD-dependent epimerase/dehydratase family protein [Paenibacillus sp. D2_2]WMT41438.1 NAD-dependent epimerase/dehydratase family protein [Paenibacillus sp. D2_2]
MKVLVTGGPGFIGRHTVSHLLEQDCQVIVVDQRKDPKLPEDKSVTYYETDIVSEDLEQIFAVEQPDYCIHLAAHVSVPRSYENPHLDAEINIMGTINVLRACVRYKVRKIVFSSSAAVYGNPDIYPIEEQCALDPQSFYGMSKYVAESYIRSFSTQYNLDYTILRYANVYGIREHRTGEDGVMTAFIERMAGGMPMIIYGDGRQTRDFVYVRDVAVANALALSVGSYQTFNISSGVGLSLLELSGRLQELYEKTNSVQFMPQKPGISIVAF